MKEAISNFTAKDAADLVDKFKGKRKEKIEAEINSEYDKVVEEIKSVATDGSSSMLLYNSKYRWLREIGVILAGNDFDVISNIQGLTISWNKYER